MDVLAGPQGTCDEREELAELAGLMGVGLAGVGTDWTVVEVLYATEDYIKCGVAVALVDVIAASYGIVPTVINM